MGEQALPQLKNEVQRLKDQVTELSTACAELQASVDLQAEARHKSVYLQYPRNTDADVVEERRRLRSLKPGARAEQLHAALLFEQQQETQSVASERDHAASLGQTEKELKELHAKDSLLRRELSDERSEKRQRDLERPSKALKRQDSLLSQDTAQAPALARANSVDVEMMPSGASVPMPTDDDDMLYGQAPQPGRTVGKPMLFASGRSSIGGGGGAFGRTRARSL